MSELCLILKEIFLHSILRSYSKCKQYIENHFNNQKINEFINLSPSKMNHTFKSEKVIDYENLIRDIEK